MSYEVGPMALQDGLEYEMPNEQTKAKIEKAKTEVKAARKHAKAEEEARLKEALAAARLEIEQERQARVRAETARTEAERVLKEANIAAKVVSESMETPPTVPGEGEAQPRDFFIVRLEFDKPGQPGWTEIEHGLSQKKQKFSSLDGEGLTAFMRECISPATFPEHIISVAPSPERVGTPMLGPLGPVSGVIVSDVQAFHLGSPSVRALTFNPDEAFEVQAPFQLQGPEARSLTAQESSYEMTVNVIEVTSGKSQFTSTCTGKLSQDMLDYAPQVQVPGLTPGTYRLFTMVTLGVPIKMVDYYDKSIIKVK